MPSLYITLDIPAEKFLAWYQGSAQDVFARAHNGQTVQFPAKVLQRYVSGEGIQGTYLLTFDENYRFVSIEKLGTNSERFDRYG